MENYLNIVEKIRSGKVKSIGVLTGAGISCASGIPDFRSPGGMYATLNPSLLTATEKQKRMLAYDPTNVVSIDMFRQNQFPYLEVRRPFILGTREHRWKPTAGHFFIKLLEDKEILRRLYTQNIDGLHAATGLSSDHLVHVHGSLDQIECEFCKAPFPREEFYAAVRSNIRNIYDPSDETAPAVSTNIFCRSCGKAGVKPATVMYGCSLPPSFERAVSSDFPGHIDMLIVMGTSLTVQPACSLVTQVSSDVPRLVFNNEPVGEHLGMSYFAPDSRDILLAGDIDGAVVELCRQVGWLEDLRRYREVMCDASRELIDSFPSNTEVSPGIEAAATSSIEGLPPPPTTSSE